jgi:NADH-quinone oxidoreductase subunit K
MIQLDLLFFADIGLFLSTIGLLGVLLNRRNILISIICIEMILYGLNFYIVCISFYLDDIAGELFSFFILAVAAAESAIALALISSYFKIYQDITLKEIE